MSSLRIPLRSKVPPRRLHREHLQKATRVSCNCSPEGSRAYLNDLGCYGLACLALLPVQGLQPVWAEPRQGNEAPEAIHVQHHAALVD